MKTIFYFFFLSILSLYFCTSMANQLRMSNEQGNTPTGKFDISESSKTGWKEINLRGLFAIKAEGSLWQWKYKDRNVFTFERLGNASDWKHIYCGGRFNIAMKEDGTLWSWGKDTKMGQLGRQVNGDKEMPGQIGTESWKDVSAGDNFTFAIKSDGTLWGWGENKFGRIVQDANISSVSEPVQIGSGNNWNTIYASDHGKSIGLKSDGTMWVFYNPDKLYVKEPVEIASGNEWEFCISEHIAIKSDGTMWSIIWGPRDATTEMEKVLGIPQNILSIKLKQIGTDNGWKCAFLYDERLLALKKEGTIWACQYPIYYGLKSNESEISPIQLGKDNDWEFVNTQSQDISVGVKSDGSAFYWGEKSDKLFKKEGFLNNGINKAEF